MKRPDIKTIKSAYRGYRYTVIQKLIAYIEFLELCLDESNKRIEKLEAVAETSDALESKIGCTCEHYRCTDRCKAHKQALKEAGYLDDKNDQINALYHEHVMGKCVHEWGAFNNYGTHRVYACRKCPENYKFIPGHTPPPDKWRESTSNDIPDYLADPAVILGEIKKLYNNGYYMRPGHSGIIVEPYNPEDRYMAFFHVADKVVARAVLLAGLKRRGVDVDRA